MLLHHHTNLQVELAFGALQRDVKLKSHIKEKLFQIPVVENEWKSSGNKSYYNSNLHYKAKKWLIKVPKSLDVYRRGDEGAKSAISKQVP